MLDNASLYDSASSDYTHPRLAGIWNLCYHFFIPQQDLDLIREQSSKLISCSETPATWAASPYSVIRFVSTQTVDELRNIWRRYAQSRSASSQETYDTSRRSEIQATYDRTYGTGADASILT